MVWFQCEDCGENLRKPKLPNHFRVCSAHKLSCIDCGEIFSQHSVQSHMQCITEAEKYGPKNQAKSAPIAQNKVNKPKPDLDIDINVGLSTRPPWFCSLCNTTTTSKQTLLLHADGKKHRSKAKAFHASKNQTVNQEQIKNEANSQPVLDSSEKKKSDDLIEGKTIQEDLLKKKRDSNEMADGEVIQSTESTERSGKRPKKGEDSLNRDCHKDADGPGDKDSSDEKIKWKKLVTSILKSNQDGGLKVKKLEKLVRKSLLKYGVDDFKDELRNKLMDKITSSSRFTFDGKYVQLAQKIKST
ncbi:zinc ion binding protein [Wolffia australiana]